MKRTVVRYLLLFSALPYELGRLFQLQTLGLNGNPLSSQLVDLYSLPNGTYELIGYLLDNLLTTHDQPGMCFYFHLILGHFLLKTLSQLFPEF